MDFTEATRLRTRLEEIDYTDHFSTIKLDSGLYLIKFEWRGMVEAINTMENIFNFLQKVHNWGK